MDELRSLEQYVAEYPALACALGAPGVLPAAGEVEFLREVTRAGRYAFGMLPGPDALFVAAVTSILRPAAVLEIGTASGFSTAIIAKMVALRGAESHRERNGILVHTIDRKEHVEGNVNEPVGFGAAIVAPDVRSLIAVHTRKDSSFAPELFGAGELPFAFIDGNHQHPWPVHDVVQVAALMPPGNWIVMHDVNLPALMKAARAAGHVVQFEPRFGPQHVFESWPGEKVRAANIAALKLPPRGGLKELLRRLRHMQCETSEKTSQKLWRQIDEVTERGS